MGGVDGVDALPEIDVLDLILPAVRQLRAFHPLIQVVAPSRKYCELVTISTAQERVNVSIPS